jgi:Domain of unknown function (DUF4129)
MGAPGWDQGGEVRVAESRRSGRRGPPQPWRVALLTLTAAGLLAVVAAGSLRGPLGGGRGRPSYPAGLVDSLLALLLVAVLAGLVLAVVVLVPDQRMRAPRSRRRGLLTVLFPTALILAVWLFREPLGLLGGLAPDPPPTSALPGPDAAGPADPTPDPGVVPLLVAGVAVVAMAAVALLLDDRRRRGPARSRAELLVELLDDTLVDVEREPDPRRAVIAAWARMERGLAAAGLPRRAAEAPFEYAARVLAAAQVDPRSVRRLTDLFERAKFSRHAVDRSMRDEALAALRAVRADLAAAADAEQPAAAAAPGEAATGGAGRR